MTLPEPYTTARGVEAAIKASAKKAASADPSLSTDKRIQMEYFNRFLSRIFSEGEESAWVLKGGTGMLARIPSTRATRDIDLDRQNATLDQALAELKRLAAIDLNDHFRFEYLNHETSMAADVQPYTDAYRVTFNTFVGATRKNALKIDLVVGSVTTGKVSTISPANALPVSKLISNPYRIYPIVDQLADKVCATMDEYGGRPSACEKDLVDIVVCAVTQSFEGAALRFAIETERQRRQMEFFERFAVPSAWGRGYATLSAPVPHCKNYRTIESAVDVASALINPALIGEVDGKVWSPRQLQWQ